MQKMFDAFFLQTYNVLNNNEKSTCKVFEMFINCPPANCFGDNCILRISMCIRRLLTYNSSVTDNFGCFRGVFGDGKDEVAIIRCSRR